MINLSKSVRVNGRNLLEVSVTDLFTTFSYMSNFKRIIRLGENNPNQVIWKLWDFMRTKHFKDSIITKKIIIEKIYL